MSCENVSIEVNMSSILQLFTALQLEVECYEHTNPVREGLKRTWALLYGLGIFLAHLTPTE